MDNEIFDTGQTPGMSFNEALSVFFPKQEAIYMDIKDMVKDHKKVRFSFYRDRELWYITEAGFEFPVPIEEVGNATFMAEDRAILFMRYIRKHMEMLAQAKKEHEENLARMATA